MRIITVGPAFIDIDAYACIVAYAELLELQGVKAQAVCTAPMNESITHTVRSWNAPLRTDYTPNPRDTYTVIDNSDPTYFEKFVDSSRIDEVIDHHLGFEKYWQQRIGDTAHIEFIGAACTLVYERWKAAGLLGKMSALSAQLLVCGILDNTLNFGAKVTTQRDREAYTALLQIAGLPADWPAQYFGECQEGILADPASALQTDTKTLQFKTFGRPLHVAQLAIWDIQGMLAGHQPALIAAMAAMGPDWFVNIICISEGKSYLLTANPEVQGWLSELLEVQFAGQVATADRLWLRKEIIKQDISIAYHS